MQNACMTNAGNSNNNRVTSDGRHDETRGLEYPCGEPPAGGEVSQIAPGLLWLRMPLPFTLDHINVWAIADHDASGPGWAIVDFQAFAHISLKHGVFDFP